MAGDGGGSMRRATVCSAALVVAVVAVSCIGLLWVDARARSGDELVLPPALDVFKAFVELRMC